jgi:hypothetical protein
VNSYFGTALAAGATVLKPAAKSFWGYGGVLHAPDGAIWKITTSAKKDTGPAVREVDQMVLLLGVADVAVAKRFYVERGLGVAKSFGRKYVEFATGASPVKLALYGRRAAAKDAGVSPEGSGSHRLTVGSDAGTFTDPDGFAWEAVDWGRAHGHLRRRQPHIRVVSPDGPGLAIPGAGEASGERVFGPVGVEIVVAGGRSGRWVAAGGSGRAGATRRRPPGAPERRRPPARQGSARR